MHILVESMYYKTREQSLTLEISKREKNIEREPIRILLLETFTTIHTLFGQIGLVKPLS